MTTFFEGDSNLLTAEAFEFVLDSELKRAVRSQNYLTLVTVEASREWEGMTVTADDGTLISATKGVRLHDLRHTAAVLWLTAGVHFIQVAKWLGHSSYVLTLTTYAVTACPHPACQGELSPLVHSKSA